MKLFAPDLYRNFAIGFGAGAMVVVFGKSGALIAAVPEFLNTLF